MSNETKTASEYETVQAEARKAAKEQVNITKQVRDITLNALTKGKLDGKRIKNVVNAVMEGVSLGVSDKNTNVKETMSEAVRGVDEALTKTATASKFAIEEAFGKIKDYNKDDLNKAVADLKELEGLLFDTLSNVAKSSGSLVKGTLNDILVHIKQTGSSTGKESAKIAEDLTKRLGKTTHEVASAGAEAAKIFSQHVAQAASGFLTGLADSIKPKDTPKK